ncbi:FAD-dependent oxidoreductase [Neiella marina]|uniref:FAD-dependent oxidoreductase n=1 Tax=Neiella holothuriorum TaxID=2870530 RepID=A0ABS7EK01_9GAMM|nr:FAD-dependent oxidoreductase [Neiella holothuriorum]MBW8192684.1 FAD-dependent oxidoreductase [Neiella holothuriorum]
MQSVDIVIIGGGMVGLSAAIGCARLGYQVVVVDQAKPPQAASDVIANRVSAISAASQRWLTQLDSWAGIEAQRATAYQTMAVWQADQLGELHMDANELGQPALGHIVENQVVTYALFQQAQQQTNLQLLYQSQCQQLHLNEREAWLALEGGQMIGAQLVICADGANSWGRQQANLPLTFRDYGHHAIVATVRTEQPHQHCARQAFTAAGPLAFLPLHDEHLCSIVWSIPPAQAEQLMALPDDGFNRKLTAAFDAQLGLCRVEGERAAIPLTMRYARRWLKHRLVLMGDAAHTIHPLAGQGVNLGFADAAAFVAELAQLTEASAESLDLGEQQHWRSYERQRKTAAVEMIAAMEGIKQAFSLQASPLRGIIGAGMNLVNQLSPVKNALVKKAMGL